MLLTAMHFYMCVPHHSRRRTNAQACKTFSFLPFSSQVSRRRLFSIRNTQSEVFSKWKCASPRLLFSSFLLEFCFFIHRKAPTASTDSTLYVIEYFSTLSLFSHRNIQPTSFCSVVPEIPCFFSVLFFTHFLIQPWSELTVKIVLLEVSSDHQNSILKIMKNG